jgi:hypothetical protein
MNTKLLLLVVILSGCATNLFGMNYDEAYRLLMSRYGTTPSAGESPEQFQRRVASSQARSSLVKSLATAKAELADVRVQIQKLEIQIRTGMILPADDTSVAITLTEDDKAAMLRELFKLEETKVWLESRCRNLDETLAKEDAQAEREALRREINDALSRQAKEIRREIEDEWQYRRR